MTKKEKVSRNIGLTFDFLRQAVSNPALLEQIPDGSTLEFVDKDFPVAQKPSTAKNAKRKTKYLKVKSELKPLG